jgi:hypothetical protein
MDKKTAVEVIAAVMDDVQAVGKKDRNASQGFNFRGIDAVMNAVGPALRAHGGFVIPVVESVAYETATSAKGATLNIARVFVKYEVHGQVGEPVTGSVVAEAFDMGDKATAKAMSVAYRTFLLQLLCLPTDEPDPDTFSYQVEGKTNGVKPPEKLVGLLSVIADTAELQTFYEAGLSAGWMSDEVRAMFTARKNELKGA